ncbi:zinc finger MYM-type protein 1-like protein [Tanacetum coccineum]
MDEIGGKKLLWGVAQDGSGDYKTISAAIAAVPKLRKGNSRFVIHVKVGVYKENVEIKKRIRNLMIFGDGMGSTIVTSNKNVQDGSTTFHSATFVLNWKTSIVSFVLLSRKEELNMSTVKKKVRILDWFTPIQKKAKTQDEKDFNVSAIPHDPRLRINILDYNPNDQDVVRSEYMERGPCRPLSHNFPQTKFRVKSRRFNPRWFNKYDWLEYSIEVFCTIIDLQLQELNNRFNEVNSKLLMCMGSLSPLNCFSSFNSKQLITLAEFYPNEFPRHELSRLSDQLDNYIHDMRKDERFIPLKDVGDLSLKLVELKKHTTYDLVYLLIKLVLILPVATASVERTFSAMTYVKNKLRNSIGDQFLNDCLVTFIEKDVFFEVSHDTIMNRFQLMRR